MFKIKELLTVNGKIIGYPQVLVWNNLPQKACAELNSFKKLKG